MGWYQIKPNRITMEQFGRPDLWIDLRPSVSMTQDEADKIAKLAEDEPLKSVAAMIVRWRMTDPLADDEIVLATPTVEDPSTLRRIPGEILNYLGEQLMVQQEREARVSPNPPVTGSESGPGF